MLLRWPVNWTTLLRMEALGNWTLALLLRLLGTVPCGWAWTPMRTPFSMTHSYLNAAQRPLWILEDELMKRQRVDRPDADYATTTRASMTMRRARNQRQQQEEPRSLRIVVRPDAEPPLRPPLVLPRPAPAQRRLVLPHRLQLPSHYVQHQLPPRGSRRQARTDPGRRRQPQSLPIFDNAPGDNTLSASNYPIFVYNGSRGELLVNTMLSTQRYPMQEPVPGQVLYPPSTPMFRPKPIVERFRMPGQRDLLNLTLIPFYAHEAITAAPLTSTTTMLAAADFSSYASPAAETSVTSPVEDLAAEATATAITSSAPAPLALTTPLPAATPYETQLPRAQRKRNPKKAKQYNAYHSPQEVVQRPPVLRSSPPLPAPDNHRHHQMDTAEQLVEEDVQQLEEVEELEEFETELEMPSQELEEQAAQPEHTTSSAGSTTTGSSSLQIVYVDESVESPSDTEAGSTTTAVPTHQRQSSRYALKREYFAFPVYTLGKLLQDPGSSHKLPKDHVLELDRSENSSMSHDSNTWFILNSR